MGISIPQNTPGDCIVQSQEPADQLTFPSPATCCRPLNVTSVTQTPDDLGKCGRIMSRCLGALVRDLVRSGLEGGAGSVGMEAGLSL